MLAVCVAWQGLCHAADENLIANGDFQKVSEQGAAAQWPEVKAGISYPVEDGNRFLRITSTEPGKHVMIYHPVQVPNGTEALKMTFRVRWQDVEVGAQSWYDARMMMEFKNASHQTVNPKPPNPNFKGTSDGWQTRELNFVVPGGATYLAFMPSLFQAKKGTMDIDDMVLTPIKASAIPKPEPKPVPPPPQLVRSKAMPLPEGVTSAPLKVKGNRLVSMKDGQEVWLQGVAVASMEWTEGGEHIMESVEKAIKVWNANVIRLAVKSPFWFGHGKYQKDGGVKYRELVDQVATFCQQNNAYLVLDLHEYRAATSAHADFWQDAATRYANHPGVIFGLLNEPHGISWEEWRNGGDVAKKGEEKEGVAAENKASQDAVRSVGMQALVDTVRKTGARNLVSAGGLDWAYDLGGVLNGYALDDTPDGQGIMYETHVYPWKGNWQKRFLDAAEKYPILVGEVGCQPTPMPWQNGKTEDPLTWGADMIGCIQKHRLNWTAWCFHPRSSPCLLLDWDYTPTPYWGEPVLRALKGEKFEMKKMR